MQFKLGEWLSTNILLHSNISLSRPCFDDAKSRNIPISLTTLARRELRLSMEGGEAADAARASTKASPNNYCAIFH
jgi:hypothetical protein